MPQLVSLPWALLLPSIVTQSGYVSQVSRGLIVITVSKMRRLEVVHVGRIGL
jgi:hypothetical protein